MEVRDSCHANVQFGVTPRNASRNGEKSSVTKSGLPQILHTDTDTCASTPWSWNTARAKRCKNAPMCFFPRTRSLFIYVIPRYRYGHSAVSDWWSHRTSEWGSTKRSRRRPLIPNDPYLFTIPLNYASFVCTLHRPSEHLSFIPLFHKLSLKLNAHFIIYIGEEPALGVGRTVNTQVRFQLSRLLERWFF